MENNNKSSLPVAIIGIVLLVALGAGWWFYNNSKSGTGTTSNKTATPEKNWNEIFTKAPSGGTNWTKGSPTAAVTIEEFADFQCPTCAQMHPKVNEIRNVFGDRVRIVFRHFPLSGHPFAYDAALAAEAAGLQGKFWEMQNMLFSNQQSWATSTNPRQMFADYAKTLGLNVDQFSNDIIGLPIKNRVDGDLQRGRAIGVTSTPSFYINNKPLGTNLDGLRATVEKALQEAEGAKQAPPAETNTNSSNK